MTGSGVPLDHDTIQATAEASRGTFGRDPSRCPCCGHGTGYHGGQLCGDCQAALDTGDEQ